MKIRVPGHYPEREYGHCFLGNGTDFLYIDWTGSMGFKEQINGIFGYWFKLDRKRTEKHDPAPLLRVKYHLVSEAGPIEISAARQKFDAEKAILITDVEGGPFRFKVNTFLTIDHLLVLHFTFHKFPAGGSVYFALDDNRITYTSKPIESLSEPVKYFVKGEKMFAEYSHQGEFSFSGLGLMEIAGENKGEEITGFENIGDSLFFPYLASNGLLRVRKVRPGTAFTCYTCVMDNLDEKNYPERVQAIVGKAKQKTYPEVKKAHIGFWQDYTHRSSIEINPEIDYLYKTSRYALKAALYPTGAIVASPVFPNTHGCLVYWDAIFDQMGFLKNNHIAEAGKISGFWLKGLEKAQENARTLNSKGAYYGWTLNCDGYDTNAGRINQVHSNGDIALSCWNYFLYTRDLGYLRRVFPILKDTMDFLIHSYLVKNGDGAYLKPCESLDESAHERSNDTWTLSLMLRGIENLKEAAALISEKINLPGCEIVKKRLLAALKKNCEGGILYSHDARGDLNVGSILSLIILDDLKPAEVDDLKTYRQFIKSVAEDSGLGWGRSSRMRCEIFPWAELITAVFLARRKNSLAVKHLGRAMAATNSFGGFAEYIWEHGLISRQWFLSAHGSFLWALTEMIVSCSDDNINLFPAVAPDWKNVRCQKLLLPGNVLFSGELRNGRIQKAVFLNQSREIQTRTVCFKNRSEKILFPAGKRVQLKGL